MTTMDADCYNSLAASRMPNAPQLVTVIIQNMQSMQTCNVPLCGDAAPPVSMLPSAAPGWGHKIWGCRASSQLETVLLSAALHKHRLF